MSIGKLQDDDDYGVAETPLVISIKIQSARKT